MTAKMAADSMLSWLNQFEGYRGLLIIASPETGSARIMTPWENEEAEVEPVYQANRDAPAIKAMGRAFGRVDPRQGGQFFAWILDGITPEAKAALSHDVPGPVLGILNGVFGRSYRAKVAPAWK